MRYLIALVTAVAAAGGLAHADVTLEKTEYGGWPNCILLSNGKAELVVTTDVGPRIIRFGFPGKTNLLKEYPDQLGKTGGDEWRIYGGHRLWHAPEAMPRTYSPDNGPVKHEWNGETLRLTQPTEPSTGIQKQLEITMDADEAQATILHRLINRNAWEVTLAPWALTVMTPGGRLVIPQEPYIPHANKLLPARPMVLWHYTDMADARWTWGAKYIQLRQDASAKDPEKVGVFNAQGWLAYTLDDNVFIKRFTPKPGLPHPDMGCNAETYTNADMLEAETVGPLTALKPDGGAVEHVERWYLFEAKVGTSEEALDRELAPLLENTE